MINEDFTNLEQVIDYFTMLYKAWEIDWGYDYTKEQFDEERKHFNNAIKYIKELERKS